MISPENTAAATREEILAELGRLDGRERGLRAQRQDTTYRLEQVLKEKERLGRHLGALGETV